MVVPTDESKCMLEKYKKLWTKTKDLIEQTLITQMIMIKNI